MSDNINNAVVAYISDTVDTLPIATSRIVHGYDPQLFVNNTDIDVFRWRCYICKHICCDSYSACSADACEHIVCKLCIPYASVNNHIKCKCDWVYNSSQIVANPVLIILLEAN